MNWLFNKIDKHGYWRWMLSPYQRSLRSQIGRRTNQDPNGLHNGVFSDIHNFYFQGYGIFIYRAHYEGREPFYGFQISDGEAVIASEEEAYPSLTSAAVGAFKWIDKEVEEQKADLLDWKHT